MEKKARTTFDTRTLVFVALMVAAQIVLERIISIDIGFARVTVGKVPVVLTGLWFGPVAGAVCGLVADVVGCFIAGYAVNPVITLAAMLWGVIPALMLPMMKGSRTRKMAVMCASLAITSVLSTLFLTTLGLVFIGYHFDAIIVPRLIQWAVLTPVSCVLVICLYYSPLTRMVQGGMAGRAA